MGDEQDREPAGALERGEELENPRPPRGVEVGDGFVADEEIGARREGARDGDALAFAGGEVGGARGRHAGREPDLVEELLRLPSGGAPSREPMHLEPLRDECVDAELRRECRAGVLRDPLQAPSQAAQRTALEGEEVHALECDPPARHRGEPQDGAGDGALPRARGADEPEDLPAVDREREAIDGARDRGRVMDDGRPRVVDDEVANEE